VTEISRDIVREIGTAQQLALRACSRRFSLDGGHLQQVHRFASLGSPSGLELSLADGILSGLRKERLNQSLNFAIPAESFWLP
jgi:hypothetical protein